MATNDSLQGLVDILRERALDEAEQYPPRSRLMTRLLRELLTALLDAEGRPAVRERSAMLGLALGLLGRQELAARGSSVRARARRDLPRLAAPSPDVQRRMITTLDRSVAAPSRSDVVRLPGSDYESRLHVGVWRVRFAFHDRRP